MENRMIFSQAIKLIASTSVRWSTQKFATTAKTNFKVVVAGAAGSIGQPLSLMLKQNTLVTHLALYDVAQRTPGLAVDLSHVNTPVIVTGHGPTEVCQAMWCADVIVISAGVPRDPSITSEDLFNTNASIVRNIVCMAFMYAPQALIAIITNPVNSLVPLACEVMKDVAGSSYDLHRVLGVTTLDVIRASSFVAEINGVSPKDVSVPVVGGHHGITIVPLFSQVKPRMGLHSQVIRYLTNRIQDSGNVLLHPKGEEESVTLSMAFAAARFVDSLLRALAGKTNVIECAYVKSNVSELEFFANPVLLGRNGLTSNLGYGTLSQYEEQLLKQAIPQLKNDIDAGVQFIQREKLKSL